MVTAIQCVQFVFPLLLATRIRPTCVFFFVMLSSICVPKSISQDTAYHLLCDTLTSGSGKNSFDRTVKSGKRCSGT